jgi:hypothetical protein
MSSRIGAANPRHLGIRDSVVEADNRENLPLARDILAIVKSGGTGTTEG